MLIIKDGMLLFSCSVMCDFFPIPWSVKVHISVEFPRQEHWRGLPFPSLGNLLDPRIKPRCSALARGFLTTETPGKPTSMGTIFFTSEQ